MKKAFLFIAATVLFFSCEPENNTSPAEVLCITKDATGVVGTNAVLNGNATIKDASSANADAYFYYSATQADAQTLKATGQRVYAGTIPNTGGDFSFALGSLLPLTTYYYMASASIDGSEAQGEVKSFTTTDISVSVTTVAASDISEFGATLNASLSIENGLQAAVWFIYSDTADDIQSLKNKGKKADSFLLKDGTFSFTMKSLSSNTTYHYLAGAVVNEKEFVGDVQSFSTVNLPYSPGQAVDLGLSVKWSSTNLGATAPDDCGYYFAWGETGSKGSYYWWSTYKWSLDGSQNTLTRYNSDAKYGAVDKKTDYKDYEYADDPAFKHLGTFWRTPTIDEINELLEKCTWTWKTKTDGYAVEGFLVERNGNSIFLPAAGMREGGGRYDFETWGFYWASSVYDKDPTEARSLNIRRGIDKSSAYSSNDVRCRGLSVRPVFVATPLN